MENAIDTVRNKIVELLEVMVKKVRFPYSLKDSNILTTKFNVNIKLIYLRVVIKIYIQKACLYRFN